MEREGGHNRFQKARGLVAAGCVNKDRRERHSAQPKNSAVPAAAARRKSSRLSNSSEDDDCAAGAAAVDKERRRRPNEEEEEEAAQAHAQLLMDAAEKDEAAPIEAPEKVWKERRGCIAANTSFPKGGTALRGKTGQTQSAHAHTQQIL